MDTIVPGTYRKIVVLTGAGVSAASGLPTYRGPGGVWERDEVARYATADAWAADPLAVWRMLGALRGAVRTTRPNPAHLALAAFERGLPVGVEFTLITQNVDGLHQAAGSQNVLELHGALRRTRCSGERCEHQIADDPVTQPDALPRCPACGAALRPDVTLFGEWLSAEADHGSRRALRDCDLFVAVGTSGIVTPAASFVRSAKYEGARTILVNLEPMESPSPYFDEEILGRAEDVLPQLFGAQ